MSTPWKIILGIGFIAAIIAILILTRKSVTHSDAPVTSTPTYVDTPDSPASARPNPPTRDAKSQSASAMAEEDNGEREEKGSPEGMPELVQLDDLRTLLPENLYWELGAPTEDEDVLDKRRTEKQRMEILFGKIQSNTATNEEIDHYYDRKEAISQDYIVFAQTVLDRYSDDLPDRELGLYELARSMHGHRLEEYPRDRADAKRRKVIQDQKREAWRARQ